jgi:hypothetical protein
MGFKHTHHLEFLSLDVVMVLTIKVLLPSLQSRLDYLNEKILDAHLEGNLPFLCIVSFNKMVWSSIIGVS